MSDETETVAVAGVSHARTAAGLRERLHLPPERVAALANSLASDGREAVVLVTCNRTELYLTGVSLGEAYHRAQVSLAAHGDGIQLPSTAYLHANQIAARHLFRVVAGLDAIVLGDTHVAAQVRQAHVIAGGAGATGPLLNRLFEAAATTSKRVRSETAVSSGQTSIPAAAIAAAARIARPISKRRLLVVGAGTIAELVAMNAASRGFGEIVVANRDVARARVLADRVDARAASLSALGAEVAGADVIISATSAPGYVLTPDVVSSTLVRRRQPLTIFDLALPRDVHPAIRETLRVQLVDLDDLARVIAATERERHADLEGAERIVSDEADRYEVWRRSRAATPAIVALRSGAELARRSVLARHASALARLAPADRGLVETITAQIVAKVLHEPTLELRRLPQGGAP
jgi:glutamyl-tRNA reductase